ncbi:exodeoxyribonuclease VII small subunit [Beggiatoa alba]|nr:exodeoxyribonuclease VII small subunit [Beggiatoa alba]
MPNKTSKKTSSKNSKPLDFEKALHELENLVATMEQGDLSLEESLKHFERGVKLTRQCQSALKQAEQKVQILIEKSEEAELKPFEAD